MPATRGDPPFRKSALAAGVLYLITFASIPTLKLYAAVHEPGYVTGPGPDSGVLLGAALELIVALACAGTAVALFPVLKRQNEAVALGFVAARTIEAAMIFAGVACLLAVVTLRQGGGGAAAVPVAQALVALYDRAFLVGQGLLPAVNALLLGSLLYRSRLVPRFLPVLGLAGAPLLVASLVATAVGLLPRVSAIAGVAALPIAVWELSLGIYLVVKGFRPSSPVPARDGHPNS